MSIIKTIRDKLTAAFSPSYIAVEDASAAHYGHEGIVPGKVSHVSIVVISPLFSGKSRIDRHRMVHSAIAEEIRSIHAITQLIARTPEEWANK